MKKTLISLTIATSLFATASVNLGIGAGRGYVDNNHLKNYNFLNLRAGKHLNENSLLRLEYERSTKVLNNSSLQRALLNYEYDFNKQNKITPYTFIGAGYQVVTGDYPNSFVADAGLGAKVEVKQHIDIFAELRGLRDFKNNDNHYSGLFGIEYKFGENKSEDDTTQATPKPIDSDNDGVIDSLDKCPNTPSGVKVDKNGCPIDSDNDGVADYLDKCPNTPNGVKVDKNGCPIDSDNDGIADYLDKCPNTPNGVKVNKNGCPISFNFDIQFGANSAKIESQFIPKIKKFADFLKSNPAYHAEIQGYTDSLGNNTYNVLLSQKRAKAVYEQLLKLGIDKDRLTWAGYGAKNPIAPNNTKAGREKNRRVVAKLYFL